MRFINVCIPCINLPAGKHHVTKTNKCEVSSVNDQSVLPSQTSPFLVNKQKRKEGRKKRGKKERKKERKRRRKRKKGRKEGRKKEGKKQNKKTLALRLVRRLSP